MAKKFCSDMYSGIQFLPDHRSYPRRLFTETQWNSVAESPLQRSVRKYYIPKIPPIPVLNKLWRGAPLKFDPYGLIKEENARELSYSFGNGHLQELQTVSF